MTPPSFWARLLRQQAGLESSIPLDVEALAGHYDIDLCEVPIDGFLGLLMSITDVAKPQYGMMLKEGQTPGQRRFTIAHELGHFAIPNHAGRPVGFCLEENVGGVGVRDETEREANQFAAELLMPAQLFDRDIRYRTPSFKHVQQLAALYQVSVTACAIRWLERIHEPCALICTEGGAVRWKYATRKFPYWLPASGARVAPESGAAAVLRGETSAADPEPVPSWAWIDRGYEAVVVMESTFAIPSLGQVLSLLQVHDVSETEDD